MLWRPAAPHPSVHFDSVSRVCAVQVSLDTASVDAVLAFRAERDAIAVAIAQLLEWEGGDVGTLHVGEPKGRGPGAFVLCDGLQVSHGPSQHG